jgi:hypothetical protein
MRHNETLAELRENAIAALLMMAVIVIGAFVVEQLRCWL